MMVVMAVMAEARHLWKSYGNRPLGVNFSVNPDDSIRPGRNSMPSPSTSRTRSRTLSWC
jgi:hypothetical protein